MTSGSDDAAARLAENLRKARVARGLTQQGLAERAGLSVTGLQRIEAAERWPRADTLGAIASALDIDVTDLLGAPPSSRAAEAAAPPAMRRRRRGEARKARLGQIGPVVLLPFDLDERSVDLIRQMAHLAARLDPAALEPILALLRELGRRGARREARRHAREP